MYEVDIEVGFWYTKINGDVTHRIDARWMKLRLTSRVMCGKMCHQNLKTSEVLVNQEISCQEDESYEDEDRCAGILREIRLEMKIFEI
ncbi:hypothetical protein H5410_028697, partial [Solanum commersonii]